MKRGLKSILAGTLHPMELKQISNSYDVIGDIAIIRVPPSLEHRVQIISRKIIQLNKHIRTVLNQKSSVSGTYRLRRLDWVMGERKTETIHKEYGCLFKVDLLSTYYSPRLSHERMRIAREVKPGEVVVNMFAGVASFSIIIAKYSGVRRVYSIDINPAANKLAVKNVVLNKVRDVVYPIEGDAKFVIRKKLKAIANRVLMPLPEKSLEYIDSAIAATKLDNGMIHFYDFVHARKNEDPIAKSLNKVSQKISSFTKNFEVRFGRIVRTVGPRWFQVVLDIRFSKKC